MHTYIARLAQKNKVLSRRFFMEYAKDKIFNIRYNKQKDVLEFKKEGILRKVLKHKWMSLLMLLLVIMMTMNISFIVQFCEVLNSLP